MFTFKCEQWVPQFILNDKNGYALAKAIEAAMQYMNDKVQQGVDCLMDCDTMPEWRLDELAWETSCYYDYNAPLETKREMIRNSAQNMYRAGTPYAVEKAISAIYPGSFVQEAGEYPTSPFHFRVMASLNEETVSSERDRQTREAIAYFKNVRSVLDGIVFCRDRAVSKTIYTGLALHVGSRQTVSCESPDDDAYYLTDGNNNELTDGIGNLLIDSGEVTR